MITRLLLIGIIIAVAVLMYTVLFREAGLQTYYSTAIDESETCTSAVRWKALTAYPRPGDPPELAVEKVQTPIVWKNFRSERQQFGYQPYFEPNRLSFAPNGRPIIRDRELNLQILLDNGKWKVVSLIGPAKQSLAEKGYDWDEKFSSGPSQEESIVFDSDCHAYTVVNAYRSNLGFAFLLHSPDGGRTWSAYKLPPEWAGGGDGAIRMEVPSNTGMHLDQPPAIIMHQIASLPVNHEAVLVLPEKNPDQSLSLNNPTLLAKDTLCCAEASGGENHLISDGDLIHFAYPKNSSEIDESVIPHRWGTPGYVVTFSRSLQKIISGPTLLGIGLNGPAVGDKPPVNHAPDAHNQPALAIDGDGYLHAMISGHGALLRYRKSKYPHRTDEWEKVEIVGYSDERDHYDGYSYPSLMIDSQNRPHVVARWHGLQYNFNLVYLFRDHVTGWSKQKILLDPGRKYYGNWYNKLIIDDRDRIFLTYSYHGNDFFADELGSFEQAWGIKLSLDASNKKCKPTPTPTSGDQIAENCFYSGYIDINPGILMKLSDEDTFQLVTTDTFLN